MEISRYILELLKTHECVVIPDFGGFITNYVPAVFEEGHKRMVPPSREVIFNPKINKNDGILIHFLTEKEGISWEQARESVQVFRDQSVSKLFRGESIEFDGLGSLHFNHTGNWVFESLHPELNFDSYGLPSFALNEKRIVEPLMSIDPKPVLTLPRKNSQLLKIAASILLLIGLSLFPKPGEMPEIMHSGDLNPFQLIADASAGAVQVVREVVKDEPIVSEAIQPVEKLLPYVLVGGSFAQEENAKKLHHDLLEKGHRSELYLLDNGWFRVTIESFPKWNDAIRFMEQYRLDNPGSNVWVSKR